MTQYLKQSTAYTFQLGPFVDSTDGVTPETSLTIAASDVDVSLAGAEFADKNDTTALTGTGDAMGYYDCVLDATDTGTLGSLDVRCYVSGARPVGKSFMVVPANIYNSLVLGSASDYLQVDIAQLGGSSVAADNLKASALGIVTGSAVTGTLTVTQFTTNLTEVTNDHYNGRVVVFTSGALAGQAKAILDYDGSAKAITTGAFTEAPGNGDTFVIV